MTESLLPFLPHLLPALAIGALAGLVRGLSGFGAGLVMVPLLLLVAEPATVVPAVVLATLLTNLPLLLEARRNVALGLTLRLSTSAALAVPLGTLALLLVPAPVLVRLVGLFVIASSLALLAARRWKICERAPASVLVGVSSGLLNGAVGLGGPPVVLYLLACKVPAATARATLITFFGLVGLCNLASYAIAGLIDGPVLAWSLALVPGLLLAGWAGTALFRRTGDRHYRLGAILLLMATGLAALLKGAP